MCVYYFVLFISNLYYYTFLLYSVQNDNKRPTLSTEMTTMKTNEAYAIHHNKENMSLHQADSIYYDIK